MGLGCQGRDRLPGPKILNIQIAERLAGGDPIRGLG
jgi:hypothetical protein